MTCLLTSRPQECLPLKSRGTPIGLKPEATVTDCTLCAAPRKKGEKVMGTESMIGRGGRGVVSHPKSIVVNA